MLVVEVRTKQGTFGTLYTYLGFWDDDLKLDDCK